MTGRIQLLSDEVIGQIAAGEVVERPAAAVKELVENSLDAGASAVTVEITDGGIASIRVTDNGGGIPQRDIRLAFERHATSKLSTAKELAAISTLGFRGEALASIAAVSKVTCTTRTREDSSGLRVKNEGGTIVAIEEAACPEGTTFLVKNLFYNTPVRLKFLRKPSAEAALVSDVMMRMILSRPDVSFRLISQGRTVYHSSGDGKLESAVYSVYGSELLHSMRRVSGHQSGIAVDGYVGIGESGRGNRSHQSFFINGRYMRSGVLSTALEQACRERVMIGKYPTCALHLTMPYESVDVNVHPNKLEVRFQREADVAEALEAIVREALRDRDAFEQPVQMLLQPEKPAVDATITKDREAVPLEVVRSALVSPVSTGVAVPEALPRAAAGTAVHSESQPLSAPAPVTVTARAPIPVAYPVASPPMKQPASLRDVTPDLSGFAPVSPKASLKVEEQSFLSGEKKPLRLLGVLFRTYIMVEYEDHLLLIDQHAVHERLLFDRLMKAYDRHEAGQELMIPEVMTVTQREQEALRDNTDLLSRLGFTVEPFGETEVSIRSVPMILGQAQTRDFLREVLDQLTGEARGFTLEKRRSAILQSACKHAVKGGEELTEDAVRDLVTRMIDEKVTPTCPHGRPLVVAISHNELDKKFRRIQS